MPISVTLARKLDDVDPQLRDVLFAILDEIERQREETVTKNEFNELKFVVKELAEAQKETEQRMGALEKNMAELAQALKETALAMGELKKNMAELALAQKETEKKWPSLWKLRKGLKEIWTRRELNWATSATRLVSRWRMKLLNSCLLC
jgi:DNA polymerase sigma